MNDEQFEDEQIERDNAGKVERDNLREALARVEAERDEALEFMRINARSGMSYAEQRDAAQAQLAEALGEVKIYQQKFRYIAEGGSFYLSTAAECVRLTNSFLAMHANTPEAQAEQQEAQGAQAGDERSSAVDNLARALFAAFAEAEPQHPIALNPTSYWATFADMARAALATQPAVPASVEAMSFEYAHLSGERRTVSITREDVIEGMEDALYEKLSDQICRCEPIGETNVVECNCQDYVEEFALVSAKPAVRGAEHE